jgi:hypothetical protein
MVGDSSVTDISGSNPEMDRRKWFKPPNKFDSDKSL